MRDRLFKVPFLCAGNSGQIDHGRCHPQPSLQQHLVIIGKDKIHVDAEGSK